jgi:hypothetical protein
MWIIGGVETRGVGEGRFLRDAQCNQVPRRVEN